MKTITLAACAALALNCHAATVQRPPADTFERRVAATPETATMRLSCVSTPDFYGADGIVETSGEMAFWGYDFPNGVERGIYCSARLPDAVDPGVPMSATISTWGRRATQSCDNQAERATFRAESKIGRTGERIPGAWLGAAQRDAYVWCQFPMTHAPEVRSELTFPLDPGRTPQAGDLILLLIARIGDGPTDTYDHDMFLLDDVTLVYGVTR